MKRTLAGVAATTLAVGGMLVATAAPASAHTPNAHGDCSALTVDLDAYNGGGTNTVTIAVNGNDAITREFGGSFHDTFPLDPTKFESWTVTVDAWDDHDGHRGWDTTLTGKREACETPEAPEEYQVGIYLYEKLDALPQGALDAMSEEEKAREKVTSRGKDKAADWYNSGEQTLLATKTVPNSVDVGSGEYWYTELPDTDEVAERVAMVVGNSDVCTDWGIQQDLVRGDFDLPDHVSYLGPDHVSNVGGDQWNPAPLDDEHQELEELGVVLASGTSCGDNETPEEEPKPEPEPTIVVPDAPSALTTCDAVASDVILPANSATVTYERTDDGILATPTTGNEFGDELNGYTSTMSSSVLFPIAQLLPTSEECALVPGDIDAVCVGDTPYLDYGVSLPEGLEVDDDTPLTITFLHPEGGEDYVATDQPLEGQLLWPGASDTAPKQWPGWEQQDDGSYVETDGNYAWTRDGVEVLFEVNPEYSQLVAYPEANTACANPVGAGGADVEVVADDTDVPPAAEAADELPQTGAQVGVFAGIAVLLIAGGAVLFWLRRRIQH